ncbi:hypothetical protein PV08_11037 [Exophiala spinifera]|uniref:Zn(2)-C6 fungal-type domain-containing protein n=1 Tax=Exophiala spinifera TaxID=91928 RepID=A0A0D1ZAP1_9EURO|nr:uncharacterized protein PV08_11037 [Exophiala spinifera]KIW10077.1 hypothetical protein PV08_11037 [Exophiala spinifera]
MSHPLSPSASTHLGVSRVLKRPRAARACDRCRLKKYRCDELSPCSQCRKGPFDCIYVGGYRPRDGNRGGFPTTSATPMSTETCYQTSEPSLNQPLSGTLPRESVANDKIVALDLGGGQLAATVDDTSSVDFVEEGISEVNQHTNSIEYHGNTSSAAFLGRLQSRQRSGHSIDAPGSPKSSLISTLHNPAFSLHATPTPSALKDRNFYLDYAHTFIQGYFDNLHYIHPMVDKSEFMARAHLLWFSKSPQPGPSFVALYLSLLSLGALIRTWDEGRLGGLSRFEWSRRLYGEAQAYLNRLQFSNDLDTVQALFMMVRTV